MVTVGAWLWEFAARVNARRVLLWVWLGCLALLGAVVLRGRMLDARAALALPVSEPRTPPPLEAATPAPDPAPITAPGVNPFASRFLTELLRREERLRREEEEARRQEEVPPPAPPVEVVETEPPPVQGPPRPAARLLYRGMFTRPDGAVLALIENQSAGRTAFRRAGDQIEGLSIGAVARDHLDLMGGNEVKVRLDAGVSTAFQPDP